MKETFLFSVSFLTAVVFYFRTSAAPRRLLSFAEPTKKEWNERERGKQRKSPKEGGGREKKKETIIIIIIKQHRMTLVVLFGVSVVTVVRLRACDASIFGAWRGLFFINFSLLVVLKNARSYCPFCSVSVQSVFLCFWWLTCCPRPIFNHASTSTHYFDSGRKSCISSENQDTQNKLNHDNPLEN